MPRVLWTKPNRKIDGNFVNRWLKRVTSWKTAQSQNPINRKLRQSLTNRKWFALSDWHLNDLFCLKFNSKKLLFSHSESASIYHPKRAIRKIIKLEISLIFLAKNPIHTVYYIIKCDGMLFQKNFCFFNLTLIRIILWRYVCELFKGELCVLLQHIF